MSVFTNAEVVVLMVANAATIIFFVAIMSPRKRQNNFYNMAKPLNELCSDGGRDLSDVD
jgi:hypothetical protein